MKQEIILLGCEEQAPPKTKQEPKDEGIKIETVNEFNDSVLKDDDIWAHAFDESDDIEIPKYLDIFDPHKNFLLCGLNN